MSKVNSTDKEFQRALANNAPRGVVCGYCFGPVILAYEGGNAAARRTRYICPKHGTLPPGKRCFTSKQAVFGGE